MYFFIFLVISSTVNCQNGDVWGNCTICDYEKPTIEESCTRRNFIYKYIKFINVNLNEFSAVKGP